MMYIVQYKDRYTQPIEMKHFYIFELLAYIKDIVAVWKIKEKNKELPRLNMDSWEYKY